MLLMGRGAHGIYWPYHTVKDDLEQVDPEALNDAVRVVLAMLQRGPPPSGSGPALSVPWLPVVIPGALVWLGIALGIATGFLVGFSCWRTALGGLGWACLAGIAAGLVVLITSFGKPLYGSMTGLSSWVWVLVFSWVLFFSPLKKEGLRAGSLVCAWMTVAFCAIHPLLAFPWALMAIVLAVSTRFWPLMLLALPFPFFIVSADLWRELVFHGVLPGDSFCGTPSTGTSATHLFGHPFVVLGLPSFSFRSLCGYFLSTRCALSSSMSEVRHDDSFKKYGRRAGSSEST
jgi:hypothetical protein